MPQFTTKDGLKLSYKDKGEGNVIFCLPGLTRNGDDFDAFFESCPFKARKIALTSRGRWPSDYDDNWNNYNVPQEAEDAIALLDHLGIARALFLGTSRGGLVTMSCANRFSERVAGAVLVDIGPKIALDGLMRIIGYLGMPPSFSDVQTGGAAIKLGLGAQFPDLEQKDWERLAKQWFRFNENGAMLNYDPKLRDAVLATSVDADLWALFDALSTRPLGLIWGKNSDLLLEDGVQAMQKRNPKMGLAAIENRGHVPFLNEPEALSLIQTIFEASFD